MKVHGIGHAHSTGSHPGAIDFNMNPYIVIWEVTRACQLKCIHCRADAQNRPNPMELSPEEGLKLIDQIYEMGNPMLVFTGGDCMMREDLFELAEYAVKKGMRVSMTPSATDNVTKEKMERESPMIYKEKRPPKVAGGKELITVMGCKKLSYKIPKIR